MGGGEVKRAILFEGTCFVFLTTNFCVFFRNSFPKLCGKVTLFRKYSKKNCLTASLIKCVRRLTAAVAGATEQFLHSLRPKTGRPVGACRPGRENVSMEGNDLSAVFR